MLLLFILKLLEFIQFTQSMLIIPCREKYLYTKILCFFFKLNVYERNSTIPIFVLTPVLMRLDCLSSRTSKTVNMATLRFTLAQQDVVRRSVKQQAKGAKTYTPTVKKNYHKQQQWQWRLIPQPLASPPPAPPALSAPPPQRFLFFRLKTARNDSTRFLRISSSFHIPITKVVLQAFWSASHIPTLMLNTAVVVVAVGVCFNCWNAWNKMRFRNDVRMNEMQFILNCVVACSSPFALSFFLSLFLSHLMLVLPSSCTIHLSRNTFWLIFI